MEIADLFIKNGVEFEKIGSVESEVTLALDTIDVQDMEVPYFKLKDAEVYVDAYKVASSSALSSESVIYLPFQETIKVNDNYTLYDESDRAVFHFIKGESYPIYMKEEQRFGVNIHNRMYYIHKSDVFSIEASNNTDEEEAKDIAVLMYHFFYRKDNPPQGIDGNFVEENEFKEQLQYLKDNNYTTLTMRDVDRFMDQQVRLPAKSLAITMDDGSSTVYDVAYPLIKEYGVNATAFLITGWLGEELPEQWKQMREDGIELQSHSKNMHTGGCNEQHGGRLLCTPYDEGVQDTKDSLDFVEDGFVYCYPFGDHNDHTINTLKDAGVHMAFTTQYGKIKPGMNKLALPRIRIHGGADINRFIAGIEN